MSHKFHNSLNSSNTELQSDEISQYTPVKHNLNNNNYSSTLQNSPKSASSINKYRYNMQKKDRQTAELMFSAKISSDKDREILYSSTMKQMSPNSFNNYGNQKIYNYYPSQETDTSSIKGFESHVIRMRTPPKKKSIPSPSSQVIIPSQCPRLTPSKQDKDRLIHDIDAFLEKIEENDKI